MWERFIDFFEGFHRIDGVWIMAYYLVNCMAKVREKYWNYFCAKELAYLLVLFA